MSQSFLPTDSITKIPGVGAATKEKIEKLDISTIGDLLRHYPSRYLDLTKQTPINRLKSGQPASFLAKITGLKSFYSRNKKLITQAVASDSTGRVILTWFNNPYIKRLIDERQTYSVAGKPAYFGSILTIIAPVIEEGNSFSINTQGLVPIYPLTAGITSSWLRKKIFQTLPQINLADPIPKSIVLNDQFLPLNQAIHNIHFPKTMSERWQADKRLAFNEHLFINITNQLDLLQTGKSISLHTQKKIDQKTQALLPWELTSDQKRVLSKIYADLEKTEFTHRLIQGETGSGKTAPLIFAANQCLSAGLSCAIMAPTEILAKQHLATFQKYALFPNSLSLVTSSSKRQRRNKPTVFIGTHALLNDLPDNLTPPLAFIAIDEQHKFGVSQRNLLLKRDPIPHMFNLSATPIPRTVALGLLGDINISTIRHKPQNRIPTKTFVVSPSKFKDSPNWLIQELARGNQIFVVCPNISQQGGKNISTVKKMIDFYRQIIPETYPVFSVHGKIKPAEQEKILNQFKLVGPSVLISTSLIEVGIDIPTANIMIIHSAERFGLSQLHQLRGRVGRGGDQGFCFLVPSTDEDTEVARLKLLQKYYSGMILAKKDLYLRGAGEVFGLKQHGNLSTRLKYFWSKQLFTQAKIAAKNLVKTNPEEAARIARKLSAW